MPPDRLPNAPAGLALFTGLVGSNKRLSIRSTLDTLLPAGSVAVLVVVMYAPSMTRTFLPG